MDKRFTNFQLMTITRVICLLSNASNNASQAIWWEQREMTEYALNDLANAKEWAERALEEINTLYDELTIDEHDKDNH